MDVNQLLQQAIVSQAGSGLKVDGLAGAFGGNLNVGAGFQTTISVTPKLQDGAETKVWATEAGMYGLPSKCSLRCDPGTGTEAVWEALQKFAEGECGKAAEGLQGQMQKQMGGLGNSEWLRGLGFGVQMQTQMGGLRDSERAEG